jgi:predicted N-acetyltransferase YhbS
MSQITIRPETAHDLPALSLFVERVFGPGRYVKASERLREGNAPLDGVSMIAEVDGRIVGCSRMWPVIVGDRRVAFLGPLAVEPGARHGGLGATLVDAACEAAGQAGFGEVLLVGDGSFFGPLGFSIAPGALMPGPTDPRRILVRRLSQASDEPPVGLARVP